MPSPRRLHLPEVPQHVVQRGHSRGLCFIGEADYLEYLRRLATASKKYAVAIHAYVLMTNHVHLLVTAQSESGIPRLMQSVGAGYVRSFNRRHGRSGTLWESRYFTSLVGTDAYFWNCHQYVELNPVRAGIVDRPCEYRWSSYLHNAHGKSDHVVTPHEAYVALRGPSRSAADRYREMFASELADADLAEIRATLRQERAFGSEDFLAAVEQAWPCRRSPKPEQTPS